MKMKIQHQSLWEAKAALRGKFTAGNAHSREEEKLLIGHLSTHQKNLEKGGAKKPTKKEVRK